jgi:putative acetyltransferase
MNEILVRPETTSDAADIRDINVEAFRDHPISRQTEHLIVDALRTAGALDVSLVAVCESRVVGHIALSNARVGDSVSGWYLLGPVAVLPPLQGQGIGSALVEAGLAELHERGAAGCVLVGDPGFYSRFGFTTFPDLVHDGVPQEYVLALPFTDDEPTGRIRSHEAFTVEPESDAGRV